MVQRLTPVNATVQFSDVVNDLGVQLDSQLTMAATLLHLADLLLSASTAEVNQAVTDDQGQEDTGTRVCWKSSRLLQQRLG